MKNDDFDRLAEAIGPDAGPTREALRHHFVHGLNRSQSAARAGISRPTMTEYASRWVRLIGSLSSIDWSDAKPPKESKSEDK